MKKLFTSILLILSLYTAQAQKIVGYLPSYRDASTSNIQYAKLNTIIYAFINPNTNGTLITTTGAGAAWDFNMTHFLTVKTNCATYGTKLSISLGGADRDNYRSSRLNAVCGDPTYRATLVSELVQFAVTHNLYGIDVDWEFPKTSGERANHEALLAALDVAIAASSNPAIKIGVAVGGEYAGGVNHLNYFNNNAVQYVDDFHIMAYDFPVSYNTNHATETDAQASFNQWSSAKSIAKSQMYLGVPFYGRTSDRTLESDYRAFSVGAASYNVDNYSGYYYNGKTTLENKAQWVVNQGGQGIMIWDLGADRTDTYSLLNVIYDKMSTICPAPQPGLGPDIGFCTGNVTLNSGVAQAAGRTFSWKKDGSYVVTNSLTANTYTTSLGGTYIVEVNQSSCTKTDQILVTAGSSLGVTNATRCGPGSVTLAVNASSGTYDWYTASSGGTAVHTGLNYTFNETASNNYYVQENTGSSTYGAGKPVINMTNAWNEAGYESSNSLPRHAHKIVVSTDLTIQSVKIWTSNNATSNVKVMILKSDGLTVHDQTAFVNLATGGGPYTLTVNKTLVAGTYFVGVYAAVPGGTNATDKGIYLESNSNYPTSQSGVYSIEGKSYANYGSGFAATQTLTHYGQLFDWVITTGVVPPCGRTLVTTTINSAANTGLTVGSTSPICPGVDGTVTVQNSEANVSYQAYIGASTVGPAVNGNGGTLTLTVNNASLAAGSNTITIKGTKTGCGTVSLTNTTAINVNSSSSAPITFGNLTKTYGDAAFNLSASSSSAGAYTYSLQTASTIVTVTSGGLTTLSGAGTATLKVDQAANGCYAAGSATATLTINKATLTVTATNQSRVYGAANPTAAFTYSGFVNSETSSVIDAAPAASHTATATSNVGTATINVSGGSDNNYTLSYVAGTLTITKATVTATVNAQSRAYGDVNPTFTFTYSGFANSETSSVIDVLPTASTTATTATSPGSYTITAAGGSDNNYTISLVNGSLTITKANRTVTITSSSTGTAGGSIGLTYSTNPAGGTATWTKTNGTGTASLAGSTLSLTTIGTVTVQVDIAADVNYNATSTTQTVTISNLTTPTITFNGVSKTYGDAAFTISASSNSAGAFTYSLISSVPSGIVTVGSNGLITISGAGTATVKVDQAANGGFGPGSGTATVTISKANRTASITSSNAGIEGGTISLTNTISGGTNSPVWSVTNGTGTANINVATLSLVTAGTVNVQVDIAADANYNAASANQTVTISTATAVADARSGASFSVYPNPYETVSAVHFELSNNASVKLEVYDLSGHKIESLLDGSELSSGAYEVGLSNLPMGTYMIKLQIGSFEKNIKVVKN